MAMRTASAAIKTSEAVDQSLKAAVLRGAGTLDVKAADMNTKRAVKVIKNGRREVVQIPPSVESAASPNRWSMSVQAWVIEFQERRRIGPLPAFDSLFK